jgi:formamidopyrimidine-DNA glycosylase
MLSNIWGNNMPELPEVESLKRGLEKVLLGQTIKEVNVKNGKLVSGKGTKRSADKVRIEEFENELINKKIVKLERIAKNILIYLDSGELILVHLKMTGQLVYVPGAYGAGLRPDNTLGGHPIQESEQMLPHKHTYITFRLSSGTLYYNDVRQFGYVLYYKNRETLDKENHFTNTSVEPFSKEFTLEYFSDKVKNKNKPIKIVFLNQEIVNGLGNIYADEVCFASSVLPTRISSTLKKKEIESLYENIKLILDKAINSGGSSIANYLLADGRRGNYADYHNVYQKQDTNCKFKIPLTPFGKGGTNCTGIIKKITFSGRGTHFCPKHQK